MNRILNASLRGLCALAFVAACGAAVAQAQIRDARVISAHAGGVNFVSGDVSVRPADGKSWLGLSVKDELKSGDAVRTGADGRVEVLLNPGSYFRAGGGAEFEMADASLEDLRLDLKRGSAVVEAVGYGDMDLSINVGTPRGVVRIVRSGVYRIDVNPAGVAQVEVLKGRAFVGTALVKGGKVVREGAYGLEVSKLDKDDRDALDLWSRDRGKELARANSKLSRRGVYTMLASATDIYGGFGRYGGGLWVWNGRASCYTFLPFGYNWQSPYGHWYGTSGYFYGGGYTPPSNGGGAVVTAPGAGNGGKQMPPHEIAPPREMPRQEMHKSVPTYSAPVYSAPVQSAPVHSAPSQSMSAPARAAEELPQRNAPPE